MANRLAIADRRSATSGSSAVSWKRVVLFLLCAWIALAPALAEARAGISMRPMSQGSRGSRTYQYDGGQSFGRSMTPQPAPVPNYGARPSSPYPGYGAYGGYGYSRHPFLSGLFGGFLGAGLAGMLFGHGGWGAGGSPFGSMLGLLLQFLLIGGLVWYVVSLFRGRRGFMPAPAGNSPAYDRTPYPPYGNGNLAGSLAPPQGGAPGNPVEIPITDDDFNAWTELLTRIQGAWSEADPASLRRDVTPEMLSYFAEELAANTSRGVINRVEDVRLLNGDLIEAWREGDIDYATARLRWSARDYTQRMAPNGQEVIVAGDASRPTEATEIWTFMRMRGGRWLLSAIQQV